MSFVIYGDCNRYKDCFLWLPSLLRQVGTDKCNKVEEELAKIGCRVEYLLHTDGISSTMLRDKLINK